MTFILFVLASLLEAIVGFYFGVICTHDVIYDAFKNKSAVHINKKGSYYVILKKATLEYESGDREGD